MDSSKEEKIAELLAYGRDLVARYNGTRDPFARLALKKRMRQLSKVLSQGVSVYYKQKQYHWVIRFARLLQKVTRVLRAPVDRAITHMNLGRAHRQLGELEEALSNFEKAHLLLKLQEAPALEERALSHIASVSKEMKRIETQERSDG